jgi:hypothetical protein
MSSPELTPEAPEYEATMWRLFRTVALTQPDGVELPGDVLYAFTQAAIANGVYLSNRTVRTYLRSLGIRERRIPELNKRRYLTGIVLRDGFTNRD